MSTRRRFQILALLSAGLAATFKVADLPLACAIAIGMTLAFLFFAFTFPPEGTA